MLKNDNMWTVDYGADGILDGLYKKVNEARVDMNKIESQGIKKGDVLFKAFNDNKYKVIEYLSDK